MGHQDITNKLLQRIAEALERAYPKEEEKKETKREIEKIPYIKDKIKEDGNRKDESGMGSNKGPEAI